MLPVPSTAVASSAPNFTNAFPCRTLQVLAAQASFTLNNGKAALVLNKKFLSLTPNSACTSGQEACIDGDFAQCDHGKFVIKPCPEGARCHALPLVNKAGTSLVCTTEQDVQARIAATGAGSGINR
jgi:hypothetical protein